MALRELRIAEQMSEHLEEEYQMHIQRSRQTTQENFSMNRFEGTSTQSVYRYTIMCDSEPPFGYAENSDVFYLQKNSCSIRC